VDHERIERLDGAVAAFDALEGARAHGKVWEPHYLDLFQGCCPGKLLREPQPDGTGEQRVEDPIPGVRRVGRVDGKHFLSGERAGAVVRYGLPCGGRRG
jgi:hypothetical protein